MLRPPRITFAESRRFWWWWLGQGTPSAPPATSNAWHVRLTETLRAATDIDRAWDRLRDLTDTAIAHDHLAGASAERVSDSIRVGDALTAAARTVRRGAETLRVVDALRNDHDRFREAFLFDSIQAVDSGIETVEAGRLAIDEIVGVADPWTVRLAMERAGADRAAIADALATLSVTSHDLPETLVAADALMRDLDSPRRFSDDLLAVDQIQRQHRRWNRSLADGVLLLEGFTIRQGHGLAYHRSLVDHATGRDSIREGGDLRRQTGDGLRARDRVARGFGASGADGLRATDVVGAFIQDYRRRLADSMAVADVLASVEGHEEALADSVDLSHSQLSTAINFFGPGQHHATLIETLQAAERVTFTGSIEHRLADTPRAGDRISSVHGKQRAEADTARAVDVLDRPVQHHRIELYDGVGATGQPPAIGVSIRFGIDTEDVRVTDAAHYVVHDISTHFTRDLHERAAVSDDLVTFEGWKESLADSARVGDHIPSIIHSSGYQPHIGESVRLGDAIVTASRDTALTESAADEARITETLVATLSAAQNRALNQRAINRPPIN